MPNRPNILWYCTDQQRFDTVGALNNPYVQTPRLDAFMREATTFTHAYCQSPICTPSRASFLTGMYPSAVHVNGNGSGEFPAAFEDRLVTHRLAREGYDCGLVGKLHLASAAEGVEARVDDGYRAFYYSHDHRGPDKFGHDYAEWIRRQGEDPRAFMADPVTGRTYGDGAPPAELSAGSGPPRRRRTTSRPACTRACGAARWPSTSSSATEGKTSPGC